MLHRPRNSGGSWPRVRELAELTQADLAARLGMSQSVVSRIASGERRLENAEFHEFAEAIGTEEARGMETRRSREWNELSRPPLGHPDHDLLWMAEVELRQLRTLLGQPDIAQAFARRIEGLCREIETAAGELLKRECSLVFIGMVGVGKTSAICHLANLAAPKPGSPRPSPVLDVGAGRTTLCEVYIRPWADEYRDRTLYGSGDACPRGGLRGQDPIRDQGGGERAQDDQMMSREVERALRNMADLKRPSGRRTVGGQPLDPARELVGRVVAEEQGRGTGEQNVALRLQFEILSRMHIDRRQRLDVRWHEGAGVDRLQWLKSEFHRTNIGDNPEFTIPRRIHVFVDGPLITGAGDVEVSIVDTKGSDETVAQGRSREAHWSIAHRPGPVQRVQRGTGDGGDDSSPSRKRSRERRRRGTGCCARVAEV